MFGANISNIFGISFFIAIICVIVSFVQLNYNFFNNNAILLQYDYIIVGGGTAGCVIAGQLAVQTNNTILLIEAGDHFNIFSKVPLAAPLFQRSKYDWSFKTESQTNSSFGFFNQSQLYPRGKGLGGSGQINYFIHSEPTESDYEIWKHEYNITTWNFKSLFPYFRKMLGEDINFSDDVQMARKLILQKFKYMYVTDEYTKDSDLSNAFKNALKQLNDIIVLPTLSTLHNGKRWTSFDGFLKPYLNKKNLHILLNTQVKRIIFSGKRAIGVETNSIKASHIYIRKEIILSAGAIKTPQILLLSGIGPKDDLKQLNIPLVSNVYGVGKNLHDHLSSLIYISVNKSISTTVDKLKSISEIWKYLTESKGLLSYLPMMAIGRSQDGVTFVVFGMGSTDEDAFREMANFKPETFRNLFPLYHNSSQEGFVLLTSCLLPKSRGTVQLHSTDYTVQPKIDPHYLQHPYDLNCMINGLKKIQKIIDTDAFKQLNATIHWPTFPQCNHWIMLSDKYFECILRMTATTGYHPAGTCRMGHINDPNSVVNEQLRVKGVRGLRIMDASVLPSPTTHFPNSLLIAIADRSVSLILNKF